MEKQYVMVVEMCHPHIWYIAGRYDKLEKYPALARTLWQTEFIALGNNIRTAKLKVSQSRDLRLLLKLFRDFLTEKGCVCNRTKGGHEHWTRADLKRAVTIQTHIDPIPEFIIKNALMQLGFSKKDFPDWI